MKTRTDEEILAKLEEIYAEEQKAYTQIEFEIHHVNAGTDIKIFRMYDAPGLSFEKINELAKFFDTMNVETGSEFHHGGCESCDYGSEYGFTLYVRKGKSFE